MMGALKIAVVAMGVAILGGSVTLVVLLLQRGAASRVAAAPVLLDQPVGTWIAGVTGAGDGVALWLSGGGMPDRVVLVDPRRGRVGEVRLIENRDGETKLGRAGLPGPAQP